LRAATRLSRFRIVLQDGMMRAILILNNRFCQLALGLDEKQIVPARWVPNFGQLSVCGSPDGNLEAGLIPELG